MLLLTKNDIQKVFTMKDAVEADKLAFRMLSNGNCETPLRTVIQAPAHDGNFLFMPAYAPELENAALKVVCIFPHNIDRGIPSAPAQVFLIDGTNGCVSAVLDGTYVTQLRTGAASGAALDVLARKDAKKGALIGTGGQAASQLEAMLAVRNLKQVKVFDLNAQRTQEFVDRMQKELSAYGAEILAAKTSEDAVEDADILITVTPSSRPVFDGTKIKAGCTISCVGAYQPHMQELDPRVLPRVSKIYFDSRDAVLAESGDIIIPLKEGIISEVNFTGEIGDAIAGRIPKRENDDEIILFETVGVAIQDLVTAKQIVDKAKEANVGIRWNE